MSGYRTIQQPNDPFLRWLDCYNKIQIRPVCYSEHTLSINVQLKRWRGGGVTKRVHPSVKKLNTAHTKTNPNKFDQPSTMSSMVQCVCVAKLCITRLEQ